jgi:hypothetical protein
MPRPHERTAKRTTDGIDSRWGNYTITPARMAGTEHLVPNRVPFGSVKELEEFVTGT